MVKGLCAELVRALVDRSASPRPWPLPLPDTSDGVGDTHHVYVTTLPSQPNPANPRADLSSFRPTDALAQPRVELAREGTPRFRPLRPRRCHSGELGPGLRRLSGIYAGGQRIGVPSLPPL